MILFLVGIEQTNPFRSLGVLWSVFSIVSQELVLATHNQCCWKSCRTQVVLLWGHLKTHNRLGRIVSTQPHALVENVVALHPLTL